MDVAECAEDRSISVFPNPAQDQFRIVSEHALLQVEIFNAVGQRVYNNSSAGNQLDVNVQDLANGLYIVKIQSEKGYATKKINVLH